MGASTGDESTKGSRLGIGFMFEQKKEFSANII